MYMDTVRTCVVDMGSVILSIFVNAILIGRGEIAPNENVLTVEHGPTLPLLTMLHTSLLNVQQGDFVKEQPDNANASLDLRELHVIACLARTTVVATMGGV